VTTAPLEPCHRLVPPFTYSSPEAAYNAIVLTSSIHDGLDGSHHALFSRARLQCQHPDTWHSPHITAAYAPDLAGPETPK
jgi:hypothetical protein